MATADGIIKPAGLLFGIDVTGTLSNMRGEYASALFGGIQEILGPDKTIILIISTGSISSSSEYLGKYPQIDGIVNSLGRKHIFRDAAQEQRFQSLSQATQLVTVLLDDDEGSAAAAKLFVASDMLGLAEVQASRHIVRFGSEVTWENIVAQAREILENPVFI